MSKTNRKVVLVTGASSDIGQEIATLFAKNNYDVVIHYYKNINKALELQKNIHKSGGKSLVIQADISNTKDVIDMFYQINDTFGRIDVVVNNAGIALDNDIYDKTKEEFMRVLEVNLIGTFLVIKEATKYMKKGIIINISSTDGIDTYNPFSIDYSVSKAGINLLTKILTDRFPNLNFYTIAPNWVRTESVLGMSPIFLQEELKRIGQKKLIEPIKVAKEVYELTTSKIPSGSIIRIDE